MNGELTHHRDCLACVTGQEHTYQQHILSRIDAALARMRAREMTVINAISIANLLEKRALVEAGNFVVRPANDDGIRIIAGEIARLTRETRLRPAVFDRLEPDYAKKR